MHKHLLSRIYQYSLERFHPVTMGLLSVFLSLSFVLAVAMTSAKQPSVELYFVVPLALYFFLLRMRLFDEWKDADHDRQHYPTRPVPRGLVSLRELSYVLIVCMGLEGAIAISYQSIAFFSLAFGYSLLMYKEFFVSEWLRKHFSIYVFSHEILLIPLFGYLFILSGATFSQLNNRVILFTLIANGAAFFALELTRKFRSPSDDKTGNDTYTSQYGIVGASLILVSTLVVHLVASLFLITDKILLIPGVIILGYCLYTNYVWTRIRTRKMASILFMAVIGYISCMQAMIIFDWMLILYGNYSR